MSISGSDHPSTAPPLSFGRRLAGALLLMVSAAASLLLVLEHFGELALPFCGPKSGCAALTSGWAGHIAGWPVSFAGLAYFTGLLLAWVTSPRDGFASGGKWLTRLGLLASLWFLGVMQYDALWCSWCLAVHAGNVLFWCVSETTPGVRQSRRPVVAFLATSLALFTGLNVLNDQTIQGAAKEDLAKLRKSIAEIIDASRSKPAVAAEGNKRGFIGRYARGPARAPIRLVLFTDYQCPFCQVLDDRLSDALEGRDDISYSVKHYPLCQECNPTIRDSNLHLYACQAAYAAEAAGTLGGREAFWAMHHWLIHQLRQRREFADEDLRAVLPNLGIDDAEEFFLMMDSDEVHARVKRDIDEAFDLGVDATPQLFVNGMQLQGLTAPDAMSRLLAALDAARLTSYTAAADRPPTTIDRLVEEWKQQEEVDAEAKARWSLGPADAAIRVVLLTDALDEDGLKGTRNLLEAAAGRTDVRIDCVHYPDAGHRYDVACLLEAAGRLGGNDRFWDVHKWLLTSDAGGVEDVLRNAERLKLEPDTWRAEYQKPTVRQIVDGDIALGSKLLAAQTRVQKAPAIIVNGRVVPEVVPRHALLERIFGQVSQSSSGLPGHSVTR